MNTGLSFRPSLTVIMPVYNEGDCVAAVVAEVRDCVLSRIPRSLLLVVDDGSTDRSPEILDALAESNPALRVLHKANGGHGDALLWGLHNAESDYLFLIDSDGQIPLKEFEALWSRRAPDAFVCGVRRKRMDPLHRRLLTRLVAGAVFVLFARRLRDANVPFKILPWDFWLRAKPYVPPRTLAPSLFLAVLASRDPSMRLIEIPVNHLPRRTGRTMLRPWRLLRFCGKAFAQLVALRRALGGS